MIKTTVISNKVKPQEVKFPVLARLKENPTIVVLFVRNFCGVVITEGEVGEYYTDWKDIIHWEILPNDVQIVLQNDQ